MKKVTLSVFCGVLLVLCAVIAASCAKSSSGNPDFFEGPRRVSGERNEYMYVSGYGSDFSLKYASYQNIPSQDEWSRVNAVQSAGGSWSIDAPWFRVEIRADAIVLNVEENVSGSVRGLCIVLDCGGRERAITVYQTSLK